MNQSIADAYNKAAEPYLRKYQTRGVRSDDVDLALSFVQKENPFTLETSEVAEIVWCTVEEALQRELFPEYRATLEVYQSKSEL